MSIITGTAVGLAFGEAVQEVTNKIDVGEDDIEERIKKAENEEDVKKILHDLNSNDRSNIRALYNSTKERLQEDEFEDEDKMMEKLNNFFKQYFPDPDREEKKEFPFF